VNRTELINIVADRTGLDPRSAAAALDAILEAVTQTVQSGDKVTIRGFGVFGPTVRGARTVRNQQTGVPVRVRASNNVMFERASKFESALNRKRGATKAGPPPKISASKAPAIPKMIAKKAPVIKKTAAERATAKKTAATRASARKKTAAKRAAATTATPGGGGGPGW
jgi:DNA-binding protein HU-beta